MPVKITKIEGTKLKAEVEGFEVISGQADEHTPPDGPSPSSLMVASLGLCVGLYAAWYLKRHDIKDEGLTVDVDTVNEREPSRVSVFNVKVNIRADLSDEEKTGLLSSVSRCFVGNTLKGKPEINYSLNVAS